MGRPRSYPSSLNGRSPAAESRRALPQPGHEATFGGNEARRIRRLLYRWKRSFQRKNAGRAKRTAWSVPKRGPPGRATTERTHSTCSVKSKRTKEGPRSGGPRLRSATRPQDQRRISIVAKRKPANRGGRTIALKREGTKLCCSRLAPQCKAYRLSPYESPGAQRPTTGLCQSLIT